MIYFCVSIIPKSMSSIMQSFSFTFFIVEKELFF